ncbi:ROK family protein [Shinella oryzae]|uniref:ROK family protein n=1 Tax=Shinella oryzae TaxID=2871820 RepID=UPI001FF4A86D|nr:ROK family protein [Shinella oryzae]UPA27285.1 ROK family protein [Shinella oryzae]
MNSDFTIGLDLGGTQVRAALVRAGKVLARTAARTDVSGPEEVMRQFRALVAEVSHAAGSAPIRAIGMCAPGPLDTMSGVIDHIPTLPGWELFPLRDRLSAIFGIPAIVENDGIAAAFGEWQYGAARGLDHVVYVTVSTGIGGGVVVDGRLMHGARGMAGHVGHFTLATEGPTCSCGRVGCFEAVAAGTAFGKRVRVAANENPTSFLGRMAEKGIVEGRHAVEGARAGDAACLALIAEEADWLGSGFASLLHLYSPQMLVMGGGVSVAFDLLEPGIRARIRHDAMAPFREVPVVQAKLGDDAGLVGVAELAVLQQRTAGSFHGRTSKT